MGLHRRYAVTLACRSGRFCENRVIDEKKTMTKPYFNDWFRHISWVISYDRKHRGHSRWQQCRTILRSIIDRWTKYKKSDRTVFFDWSRLKPSHRHIQYKPQFVNGEWVTESARKHQEWDISLSQIACGRVCGKPINGHCPYPFELDELYWIEQHRLPIFSSYARRAFTPMFEKTEDVSDAETIRSRYGGVQRYTINGNIKGWIVQRNYKSENNS